MNHNLSSSLNRRHWFGCAAAVVLTTTGCDKLSEGTRQVDEAVQSTVQAASTTTLRNAKLALRGYEIVSFFVAKRVATLPVPAARIVAATLVVSSVGAKVVIDYIDEELIVRRYSEKLAQEEQTAIEVDGFVKFKTSSGKEENVYLAPTEYED
ncbi:MAG: hypothetical protein ABJZ55_08470 [Fuerstiella sp.]